MYFWRTTLPVVTCHRPTAAFQVQTKPQAGGGQVQWLG